MYIARPIETIRSRAHMRQQQKNIKILWKFLKLFIT